MDFYLLETSSASQRKRETAQNLRVEEAACRIAPTWQNR
jgi:hypothetical protein